MASRALVVRRPGPLEMQPAPRLRPSDRRWGRTFERLRGEALGTPTPWWNRTAALDAIAQRLDADGFAVLDDFGADASLAPSLRAELEKVLHDARTGRVASTPDNGSLSAAASAPDEGKGSALRVLRGDRTVWASDAQRGALPSLPALLARTDTIVASIVERLPGDAGAVRLRSDVQCSLYAEGARYVRHVDNTCAAGAGRRCNGRRLTAVYYATHAWRPADAGELRILRAESAESPAEVPRFDVAPLPDRLAVFWSDARTPHEVLPYHGAAPRYALTAWYLDEHELDRAPDRGAMRVERLDQASAHRFAEMSS